MSDQNTRTVVYGCSDDLIEVYGSIDEEFYAYGDDPHYLGFSNGALLEVRWVDEVDGCWRIRPLRGVEKVKLVPARGEGAEDDEDRRCPGYSDKAVLTGPLSWVLRGTEWVKP